LKTLEILREKRLKYFLTIDVSCDRVSFNDKESNKVMKRTITNVSIFSHAVTILKNPDHYKETYLSNADGFNLSFVIEALTGISKEEALEGIMEVMKKL
jgi:hypothetical protein